MAYTTIDKPTDYFETLTWSGNSTDDRAISGLDFAPNWVWIKCRNNGQNHNIFDTVRGATESLESNNGNAENTDATSLKSFTSDGYTLGTGSTVNSSSPSTKTYVAWNWLASNTTASNTDGSITSTVSANTTAGFSIVTYTGDGASSATIGHGLGSAPAVLINKTRSLVGYDWNVQHKSLGATKYLYLSSTAAEATNIGMWNNTAPTSSVFTVGTYDNVNKASETYVTYCFSEVKSFSKMGSYTGNGNANGTFVYTGFKPALVIFKNTETTANWGMIDNKRDDDNVVKARLFPNLSDSESSSFDICDFTAQGFKLRTTDSQFNSANKIIYMAFAENPFTTSTGVPATAR